jgi:hypothetical protein
MAGQQHPRFDMRQSRRHEEKVPDIVDVEQLHPLDVRQILFSDQGDRDVVNIDFVFFNQMDKKVHGAFEHILKADFVLIRLHLGAAAFYV